MAFFSLKYKPIQVTTSKDEIEKNSLKVLQEKHITSQPTCSKPQRQHAYPNLFNTLKMNNFTYEIVVN